MRLGDVFREKVRLPIWLLIPLLLVGLLVPIPTCNRMAGIEGIYATLGFMAVAIRYWWAWVKGAPLFDWAVLMVLCLTMSILIHLFVSVVADFV